MESSVPGYQRRWWALLFIAVSLLVISLDNTVLNVALPSISRDLNASASDLQWIVDAYILVFAALLLTMGSLSDRIGRKLALQGGLIMFGLGSLAAALSGSTEMLIASRAFLGIGGAVIMPATLSIISATFPPGERSQAIAIWAAVFGLGVGIGPLVGGYLLEHYSWNAVFSINLPVVVVALLGGHFFISESKDESAAPIDGPGVLLSIVGLFALVYGIIEAGVKGWLHNEVLAAFAVAAIFLLLFAWWESRTKQPMLPMYFFRNMSFTGANTALALVTFSLFGSLFFLSQFLQSVLGFTALETGIRLLPMALVLMLSSALSARVAQRLGTKYTVALGIFIAAAGMFTVSSVAAVDTGYGELLLGLIIFAVGMGMTMSPATNSIMQSVPVNKAGIGSAMNDTTRQLGGALGVAVLGTVMNNTYLDKVSGLKEQLPALPPAAFEAIQSSIQGAHIVAQNPQLPPAAQASIIDSANQAFVSGMQDGMMIAVGIMIATSLLTLLLLPNEVRRAEAPSESPDDLSNLDLQHSAAD